MEEKLESNIKVSPQIQHHVSGLIIILTTLTRWFCRPMAVLDIELTVTYWADFLHISFIVRGKHIFILTHAPARHRRSSSFCLSHTFLRPAPRPPSRFLLSVSLTLTNCALLWLKPPDAPRETGQNPVNSRLFFYRPALSCGERQECQPSSRPHGTPQHTGF